MAHYSTYPATREAYRLLHRIWWSHEKWSFYIEISDAGKSWTKDRPTNSFKKLKSVWPKVDDYVSELKHLFKQAYSEEGLNSTVLLQKFLTGLLAPIARQMLLIKKPDSLSEAIKDTVTIEYALYFDRSSPKAQTAVFPLEPINMLSGGGKQSGQKEEYTKLQKTVKALAKQLECLETNLKKSLKSSPSHNHQTPRQNREPCRHRPVGPYYRCGQEGNYYCQCHLNYHWPVSKMDYRWPQNQ